MKKKILAVIAMLLLVTFSTFTVYANDVFSDGETETNDVETFTDDSNPNYLGPTDSIQFMLAKLQLAQSQISKNSAETYMKQIEEIAKKEKEVALFIEDARQLREEAQISRQKTKMPADMAAYMDSNNLDYIKNGNDLLMSVDEWVIAIESLYNYQEKILAETKELMVYLQAYMSQYNSYLQGASSAIDSASEALVAVSRGQSMYGTSEAGLAVTGLVLGLVLGCTITLVVQKLRRKKEIV